MRIVPKPHLCNDDGAICQCNMHTFTDHYVVVEILMGTEADQNGRRSWWTNKLAEFNFTLSLMKRQENRVADALSRLQELAHSEASPVDSDKKTSVIARLSNVTNDPEL